jgi:hypothetical protein
VPAAWDATPFLPLLSLQSTAVRPQVVAVVTTDGMKELLANEYDMQILAAVEAGAVSRS